MEVTPSPPSSESQEELGAPVPAQGGLQACSLPNPHPRSWGLRGRRRMGEVLPLGGGSCWRIAVDQVLANLCSGR